MPTRLLSASRIGLAQQCVAWLHEDGPEWGEDNPSPAMRFGSALHACIERELEGEDWTLGEVALEYGLSERQRADLEDYYCSWDSWRQLRPWLFENVEVEIPFAFDPETGVARRLEKGGHREYIGAKPHEIVGTVDALAMVGDHPVVIDWKAGGYRLPPPSEHAQTRTNTLLAAYALKSDEATGMLAAIRADRVWHESDEFDSRAITGTLGVLMGIHRRRLAPIEYHPGKDCKNCPAFKACKAHKPAKEASYESKQVG